MSKRFFQLQVDGETKKIMINHCYCIGYSGRDKEETFKHIKELAELGVPKPSEVPVLYPMRSSSVSQEDTVDVLGDQTSGEAEIVLIFGDTDEEVYVTVGSDHTDRALEAVDIGKSKQVCDKPFASKAWRLNDVLDYWDELVMTASVFIDGKWHPYQNRSVEAILHPNDIFEFLRRKRASMRNAIFFSGTVPLLDGFKYGDKFKMSLLDPVKNDEITAEYEINHLKDGE